MISVTSYSACLGGGNEMLFHACMNPFGTKNGQTRASTKSKYTI